MENYWFPYWRIRKKCIRYWLSKTNTIYWNEFTSTQKSKGTCFFFFHSF